MHVGSDSAAQLLPVEREISGEFVIFQQHCCCRPNTGDNQLYGTGETRVHVAAQTRSEPLLSEPASLPEEIARLTWMTSKRSETGS